MARGPQVALGPGHRAEADCLGAELRCLPRGWRPRSSPPQLAAWRTWRGEPGACPARPAGLIAQEGGKTVLEAGSVARHVCREGSPAVLLPPPPPSQLPCRAQRLAPGHRGPLPSQVRQHRLSDLRPARAVSGWWGLGPPRSSLRDTGPVLCPVLRAGGPRIAGPLQQGLFRRTMTKRKGGQG